MELDACCEWVSNELSPDIVDMVRAARRPKPPPLKEQALRELGDAYDKGKIDDTTYDSIKLRRLAFLSSIANWRHCPMTNLSPAAQAVLDAVEDDCIHPADRHRIAAAALRAAADQIEPEDGIPSEVQHVLDKLLAIADELEAQP
jgi:hypothetical protein